MSPVVVSGGLRFTSVTVSPNHAHTCALTTAGAAYCWGENGYGQLGNGSTDFAFVPTAVTGGLRFSTLVAGWQYSCGLSLNGEAWCWGWNRYGLLGIGSDTGPEQCVSTYSAAIPCSRRPVAVVGGLTFSSLTAGVQTCGITKDGGAYCWGLLQGLRQGVEYSNVPVKITGQP